MAKKVKQVLKIQLPASSATPAPPVGTALSGTGVSIMEFCKAFNDKTSSMEKGLPTPTVITIYTDSTFDFVLKGPPASYFIKKLAKLDKGSSKPGHEEALKTLSMSQVKEIAELKMPDLNAHDIDSAIKIISGSARSMGVVIKE